MRFIIVLLCLFTFAAVMDDPAWVGRYFARVHQAYIAELAK